jgi:hypothetical protein
LNSLNTIEKAITGRLAIQSIHFSLLEVFGRDSLEGMRECAVHGVPDLASIACDWASRSISLPQRQNDLSETRGRRFLIWKAFTVRKTNSPSGFDRQKKSFFAQVG